jgi:ABC-type transport system involved in cytochrome c biogenesis permease subunit
MPKPIRNRLKDNGRSVLLALAVANGLGLLALTYFAFEPYFHSAKAAEQPAEEKLQLPAYDYAVWHSLPVQNNGRIQPMESACIDLVRQVTGRAKFEKQDPVAVVLSWMNYRPGPDTVDKAKGFPDWNDYPFILCDYHELRREMFSKEDLLKGTDQAPTNEQLYGKYLTPNQVRNSQTVRSLYLKGDKRRQGDAEKWQHNLETLERKAREVAERLFVFESIIPLESVPDITNGIRRKADFSQDPFRLVLLDKVPGGSWMALGQVRDCLENRRGWTEHWASGLQASENTVNPLIWQAVMETTFRRVPHLYLPPYGQEALQAFQQRMRNGTGQQAVTELLPLLEERTVEQLRNIRELEAKGEENALMRYIVSIVPEKEDFHRLGEIIKKQGPNHQGWVPILEPFLKERTQKVLNDLSGRVATAQNLYNPADDKHRDLHMTYLELRFPNLYKDSTAWQNFPREDAVAVTGAFDAVEQAYRAGNADQFSEASTAFARKVQAVSTAYDQNFPLVTTLDLEMRMNRVEPFRWAWVSMLLAVLLMSLHLGTSWRGLYLASLVPLAISLGFQGFAYYCRWMISGRPPVTNLYETVVFVSTMSVVFAIILEAFYRRGYLLLAGMLVGTLGLVLADQLPTTSSFSSGIGPLNPVLRSNFWLLIHVLTIVASYAAGTLAWGLGNIMLAMYLFGSRKTELLKLMANFCYKAMQIAVLLLAAGTFLGGWWAAESWGRFWGWDPKETFALIALIVYVIPLHMRYMGWVKDFGMAIAAVLCYASIFMSWYGVNFILPAGLHSYGFGSGGTMWAFWAGTLNLEFLFVVWFIHLQRQSRVAAAPVRAAEPGLVAATPV